MGTGGGIRNVLPSLRADNIMVFNGDVLGGTDLAAVLDTHHRTNADVTLHLVRVGDRARSVASPPTRKAGSRRSSRRRRIRRPTRSTPVATSSAARSSRRFRRIARCRSSARCSRPAGRRCPRVRPRRHVVLAGTGYPGRLRARFGRPGARHRAVAGLEGPRGESLVHPGAGVAPGALLIGVHRRGQRCRGRRRSRWTARCCSTAPRSRPVRWSSGRSSVSVPYRSARPDRDAVIGDGADVGARCELIGGARWGPA